MGTEHVSGFKFAEGDTIRSPRGPYRILKAFEPGAFAFAGKAMAPDGRTVFFKKYKRPGAAANWYDAFVAYQTELKQRVETKAGKLCYEFVEFFELKLPGGPVPKRAFYQVFEWVEGGTDLRGVLRQLRRNPNAFDWNQRVVFARVMMAGINKLHKAGVIHSDLKPENFMLIPAPSSPSKYALRVVDMDFSLLEGRQAPWQQEGYVGTPGYMSPEHLIGVAAPIKASDVFTCGLILGELLGTIHLTPDRLAVFDDERMGVAHPAADDRDAYDERAKDGRLRPVQIQQPIAEAPDSEFINCVINAALRPEPSRRPSSDQIQRALSGQLPEFDGTRPKSGAGSRHPSPGLERTRMVPPDAPPLAPKPAAHAVATSGAASRPATPTPSPSGGLEILGPAGQPLLINLDGTFGHAHFKAWYPDCDKFMVREQFRLFKDDAGKWMIQHCGTGNPTTANGTPITTPIPVVPGMIIALGQTGKCPVTLNFK